VSDNFFFSLAAADKDKKGEKQLVRRRPTAVKASDEGAVVDEKSLLLNGRALIEVGGASALMTFMCALCTLRAQISRFICNFTHYSESS
jgi:hypothetical protein